MQSDQLLGYLHLLLDPFTHVSSLWIIFQGFGDILNLVPMAENVIKLSAVCMTCNSDGHFTKRTTKDKSVSIDMFLVDDVSCNMEKLWLS